MKFGYEAARITARGSRQDNLSAVIDLARAVLADATAKMQALQDALETERMIETLRVQGQHDFFLCQELAPGLWLESDEIAWEPRVVPGYYDPEFHQTVRDMHARRLAKEAM